MKFLSRESQESPKVRKSGKPEGFKENIPDGGHFSIFLLSSKNL
jgi:hypothetical protein